MKKLFILFVLSAILLNGCGNSASIQNKSTTAKNSASNNNSSPSASTKKIESSNISASDNKQNTTVSSSNTKESAASSANKPLSATAKSEVNTTVKPILNSVSDALNSLDDMKDISIN